MATVSISGLFIYPIKSCKGISLPDAVVEERGLHYDRRWMLVDDALTFMTQRNFPALSLIEVSLHKNSLTVNAPSMDTLSIPFEYNGRNKALIWDDMVEIEHASVEVDEWFSTFLKTNCHLVFQPNESIRKVDPRFALNGEHTSLSDGFPFLVLSERSLHDLNEKLAAPVPMNRFRPNIVVTGCSPFDEDRWKTIRVNGIDFHLVKPCARCVVTTVDQQTGEKGIEPLRTLSEFRTRNNKVYFGQNAIASATGILHTGDTIEIIQ
jgi:uncharacterized protein